MSASAFDRVNKFCIMPALRAELSLTVDATAGKTYTAKVVDRFRRDLGDASVDVVDGTTIKLVMTEDATESLLRPRCLDRDEPSAFLGFYYIYEDDGDPNGLALTTYGKVVYLRPADWS